MVAVMIDTPMDMPGALLGRLEERIDGFDEETLIAVNNALPLQSLSLMEVSLRIAARLTDDARQAADAGEAAQSRLAGTLDNLGIRLSGLGRREGRWRRARRPSPSGGASPKPARTPSCPIWRRA
jgi:hypothetical protein